MITLLIQTTEATYEITGPDRETILASDDLKGKTIELIANAADHHVCQYCGSIAEGNYKDLLCDECRSVFGHALYSEL